MGAKLNNMSLKTIKIPLYNIFWEEPCSIIFNKNCKNQSKLFLEADKNNIYQVISLENYPTAQTINWQINSGFENKPGELEIKYL